jgi:hypothetical protein
MEPRHLSNGAGSWVVAAVPQAPAGLARARQVHQAPVSGRGRFSFHEKQPHAKYTPADGPCLLQITGASQAADQVGHGLGGANDVAVNWISVIALRLRAP